MKITFDRTITRREKFLFFSLISMLVIMIGASFNMTAVTGNGGRMPVYMGNIQHSDTHFSFIDKSDVKNFIFTDIIRLPVIFGRILIISIGDILLWTGGLGVVIFLFAWIFSNCKIIRKDEIN